MSGQEESNVLIKFTDITTLSGLWKTDDVLQCDRNFLAPNVAKTEANVVVFRRNRSCINRLVVKVEEAYALSSGTYVSAQ